MEGKWLGDDGEGEGGGVDATAMCHRAACLRGKEECGGKGKTREVNEVTRADRMRDDLILVSRYHTIGEP